MANHIVIATYDDDANAFDVHIINVPFQIQLGVTPDKVVIAFIEDDWKYPTFECSFEPRSPYMAAIEQLDKISLKFLERGLLRHVVSDFGGFVTSMDLASIEDDKFFDVSYYLRVWNERLEEILDKHTASMERQVKDEMPYK